MHAPGLFDLTDHLARLSAMGDPLEVLERHVDFEVFRPVLVEALGYGERPKGGRPPYDPVVMFKVLVLASMHNLSDERMEFLIRDRFSWLRFLGFQIGEPTPDQKTIWLFREKLTQAGVFKGLFAAFEAQLCARGYKPTGGQIVDATLVFAPRQRMTKEEKARAKACEAASDIWPDDLSKAAQKDTDARWTVKYSKAKTTKEGEEDTGLVDISVPHFGYKNHVSIDRKWRFIRGETGTNAARYDGHERSSVLDETNSSKAVWADTGYRSARNEAWLKAQGYRSHIHRKKPRGKPMARHIRQGNATRSAIRACVRLRERAHGSDHPLNRPNPCEGPHDHGQPELQLPPSHLPRATTGHSLTPPKFRKYPPWQTQTAQHSLKYHRS